MRAKTKDGERLKRLARKYAVTYADMLECGDDPTDYGATVRVMCREAKEKLYDEIDRLTSVDLTPRAVSGE